MKLSKKNRILLAAGLIFVIAGAVFAEKQLVYLEPSQAELAEYNGDFRMALSVSPFSGGAFLDDYKYQAGEITATNREELEKLYIANGATEMYTRIATKRYPTEDNIVYGEEDYNANFHTLQQGLELCEMAAKLNIPINPEIMCAYTYMDMDKQQAPDFKEYPDIYSLQHGKSWDELSIDEMCVVLEAYGKFVATEIIKTGCTVENWNIGNEANFGFAGVGIGLKTAVNPELEKISSWQKNILPYLGNSWLKKNLWNYNAVQMSAVAKGITEAYKEMGVDSSNIKFSTHIASVVSSPKNATTYFNTLKENGFPISVAGISYYPSAPSAYLNSTMLLKKIVTAINKECDLPVFIAEFSYPSGDVTGAYSGWDKVVKGYDFTQEGQAAMYQDTIAWGKSHGVVGIRYWAPDFKDWGSMSLFEYRDGGAGAKKALQIRQ
ncbi:glycosyl hydrolase 53 family protein [Lacrimispora sp.]|uniref:glycosyl hydrolase 53 family protein n=1 Tax=Lacrimispora sp. TaxID=2719234 RepID=UPI0028AA7842|nr:glycosyl hydrolase 53 family protein [Lacrimispora sp.]